MEDAYREAREAIIEARWAVEEERDPFVQIPQLATTALGEFHTLATDALKALVSGFERSLRGTVHDCDRQLKDTVLQLQSFLLRGTCMFNDKFSCSLPVLVLVISCTHVSLHGLLTSLIWHFTHQCLVIYLCLVRVNTYTIHVMVLPFITTVHFASVSLVWHFKHQ